MSIRVREGRCPCGCYTGMVALCAAETEAELGDLYLDDAVHHALSQKFRAEAALAAAPTRVCTCCGHPPHMSGECTSARRHGNKQGLDNEAIKATAREAWLKRHPDGDWDSLSFAHDFIMDARQIIKDYLARAAPGTLPEEWRKQVILLLGDWIPHGPKPLADVAQELLDDDAERQKGEG